MTGAIVSNEAGATRAVSRRLFVPLLLLACGLGFALRIYRLDAQPFWYDEGLSVDLAIAPPLYVLQTINRPPLYYLLLHFWIQAIGVNAFAFRFFSAWWGVLALPLMYRLGRQLLGRAAGAWAMGMAALSAFYIYYAQEARTYTLTLALALASSWALLAWWNEGRRRWLALYSLTTLACLYTHYAALTLPLAQAGFALTAWREGRARRHLALRWLAAMTIVGLFFTPWLLYARQGLPQLIAPQIDAPPVPLYRASAQLMRTTLTEFSAGRTLTWLLADGIAMLFLFLVVLALLSPHVPTQARRFLFISLIVPPLALALLPRTGIYFEPKYLIVASPAFYLLAIAGLGTMRRESRPMFYICLLFVLLVLALGVGDWVLAARSRLMLLGEKKTCLPKEKVTSLWRWA